MIGGIVFFFFLGWEKHIYNIWKLREKKSYWCCSTFNFFNYLTNWVIKLQALRFYNCSNLQHSGLTHLDSPRNHISIIFCDNATLSHLNISAPESSPNTDGVDISSSTNVSIHDSYIGTGNFFNLSLIYLFTLSSSSLLYWENSTLRIYIFFWYLPYLPILIVTIHKSNHLQNKCFYI